jgi:choline dehydrogenase-like flavoprotein
MDMRNYDATLVKEQQRQYDETKTGALAEGAAYSFAYWPLQLFGEGDLRSKVNAHRTANPGRQNQYIYESLLSPAAASATVFMIRMARYAKPTALDGKYLSIIAMLSHPFSRGTSHIASPDVRQPPIIDPRYLEDDLDVEVLAQHVMQLEHLLKLHSFSDVMLPGGRRYPRAFEFKDVKATIRQHAATNYHPCGTCAMMEEKEGGVVDGSLKVYGTQNLRICDASVFPIIPRGNILTTVYAVAEKATDIILEEWTVA